MRTLYFCQWTFRRLLILSIPLYVLALPASVYSQPYVEGGNTRHRFAQTYLGVDLQYVPETGLTHSSSDHSLVGMPERFLPRLTIGGVHFWGHADFYVTFPIPPGGFERESQGVVSTFSTGIETGARLYPWRIEEGGLRPFVGISWGLVNYAQRDTGGGWGPTLYRHRPLLQAGLSWMIGPTIVQAQGTYIPGTDVRYPLSRTEDASLTLPEAAFSIGVSYPFETTVGAEYAEKNGFLATIEEEMDSAGQLTTWMVGAGPSAAFTLRNSSYTTKEHRFLDNIPPSTPFPDLSLGYYFHTIDAAVNIAYRPISQYQEAYNLGLELNRTSLWLEGYKFLFDYHGFVPFVGIGIGREWLDVNERDGDAPVVSTSEATWAPGIVFGWDIRPTSVDWFTLRTNLRYAPGLSVEMPSGNEVAFDHLEFNFIQFVLYPERLFRF